MEKSNRELKFCHYLNLLFIIYTKLIIVIILTITNINILQAQWDSCNNGINGITINCFITDGFKTYVGTDKNIYMTSNNGDFWIPKKINLFQCLYWDCRILSLAISGNYIFAGTMGNGLFISSNKGDSWERNMSNGFPYRVIFDRDTMFREEINSIIVSGNNIFAGTYGFSEDTVNGFYMSTDNGNSWNPKNNGLPKYKETIQDVRSLAISGNNIFAGTSYGVYMTTDYGDNWNPKNKGIENILVRSLAINGKNIYVGSSKGLFLSTDKGDNWKNIGFKDTVISAIITYGNYILAGGGFYISSNNGKDWTKYLDEIGVLSIIINGDYVFVGTASHGILRAKLSDLGITDVKETEQTKEFKIVPNPASDEFRLRFNSPFETTVKINIYDLLGNCVLSQALQSTEGTNEKTINCKFLTSDYYYVKINVNENVQTIPLLIIK